MRERIILRIQCPEGQLNSVTTKPWEIETTMGKIIFNKAIMNQNNFSISTSRRDNIFQPNGYPWGNRKQQLKKSFSKKQ